MAKIKGEDIIEKNHLAEPISQAEKYLDSLMKVDQQIVKMAENMKKAFSKNGGKTAKEFQEINVALKQSEELKKQQKQVNDAVVKSQQNLANAYRAENTEIQRNRLLTNDRNKVVKQQIQLDKAAEGSVVQLRLKLSQLTKQYDGLSRVERENQKVGGQLFMQIRQVRAEVGALEAATGRAQRNVGNYGDAFNKATTSLKNFAAALGVVGGIQLVSRVLKDAFNVVKDFDQAQANLAAITGQTREQMAALTDQALQLGATTRFTAAEVSSLQLELAKLGFTEEQIKDATGTILDLASALNVDLASAASLTGATVRAFGLDTSETSRVTNLFVAAANKSALSFQFLEASMATIAPVSNAFGFSVEETTALLGTLANSGFDASSAATATRNILLNLADANGKLAQALGGPVDNLPDLVAGLKKLQEGGTDLGEALELTDKRSVAAFQTFLKNADSAEELQKAITGTNSAAEASAKQLDSVQGSLDLLNSAWQGYILGVDGATGASESLKNGIKFLADNFEMIMKILTGALRAWILQKVAVKLFRVETDAAGNSVTRGLLPALGRSIKSLFESVKAFRAGAIGAKGFGTALKGIPFVGIISALATVASLFWDTAEATDGAAESTKGLSKAESDWDRVNRRTAENLVSEEVKLTAVFEKLKATTAGTRERKQALDELNRDYGITLENLSNEAEFVRQLDEAYDHLLMNIERKIKAQIVEEEVTELWKKRIAIQKIHNKDLERERDIREQLNNLRFGLVDPSQIPTDEFEARELTRKTEEAIKALEDELATLTDFADAGAGSIDIINRRIENLRKWILEEAPFLFTPKDLKKGEDDVKKSTKEIKDQARQDFSDLVMLNKERLEIVETDLRKSGATQAEIDERITEERIKNLEHEIRVARELFGASDKEVIARELALQRELDKINIFRNLEENAKRAFADLKELNDERLKILEADLIESGASQEEIQKRLDAERLHNLRQTVDEARDLFTENSQQYIDANLELQRELQRQNDIAKKAQEKAVEDLKKLAGDTIKIFETITDALIENIDRRIAARQGEISQSQERINQLQELAAQGNLEASQSIKAEEAKQDLLEKQIQDLERKRRNLLIVNTALLAAQQGLEAGDQNAFANAQQSVNSFISGLPTFKEGTENTGKGGNVDGDGGFLSVLHPGERVLTSEQNQPLLSRGIANDDLSTFAMLGHDMMMMQNAKRNAKSFEDFETLAVLNGIYSGQQEQLKELKEMPKKMPVTRFHFDEQKRAFIELIKTDNEIKRYIKNIRK